MSLMQLAGWADLGIYLLAITSAGLLMLAALKKVR